MGVISRARKEAKRWLEIGFEPTQLCMKQFLWATKGMTKDKEFSRKLNKINATVDSFPEPKNVTEFLPMMPFQDIMTVMVLCSWLGHPNFPRWVGMAMPRKQGKTSHLAKLCMAMLKHGPRFTSAKGYSFASNEKQAKLILDDASNMAKNWWFSKDGEVKGQATYGPWHLARNRISYGPSLKDSVAWDVQSSSSAGALGQFPLFVVIDEAAQVDGSLMRAIRTASMGTVKLQTHICITTAGSDDTLSGWFFKRMVDDMLRMRQGKAPLWNWLMWIPPFDPDGKIGLSDKEAGSKKLWRLVCPGMGTTSTIKEYEDFYEEAKGDPIMMAEFKTFKLNVWGESSSGAPLVKPGEAKQYCNTKYDKLVESTLKDNTCVIGVDLADKMNMCAVALVTRDKQGNYMGKTRAFISKNSYEIATEKRGLGILKQFVAAEILTISGDEHIDYGPIYLQMVQWIEEYRVARILSDKMERGRTLFDMISRPFPIPVENISKTKDIGSAMTCALYDAKNEQKLFVCGNRLFEWEMGNAKVTWAASEEGGMGAKDLTRNTKISVGGIDQLHAFMHAMYFFINQETVPVDTDSVMKSVGDYYSNKV